ncbi:hypothetical protein AUG19_02960 [archaeon 13_1_20CM_2_54_9]|nr:MAG: hypothetical protein AUJ07_06865 [Crenarchaeota archaeon 13_1_40CM_3_53_5]OLE76442.1 MAG: hypothetical protein AUG19_02960 [archaeon 13_1_20CM_2_54_9]TMI24607.1 MAG: hypothetical protein E6H36_08235 [Candidatus Bathyarchaeota archaeon]TMI30366.1 MAG: hypothetical protein E6H29_08440 [Candidatus Bathyarchaeota archaeon]
MLKPEDAKKMDKFAKNFWTEVVIMLVWILFTTAAFLRYSNPNLLFASALGFTFYVAANIVLSSR